MGKVLCQMGRSRRRLRQVLPTSGAQSGQELVAQAAQRLLRAPGIEAKTRQRVNIFDQQLVGSGTYLQLAQGPRLLLKLDLKLQLGEESTSLRQISDGDFLWVLRRQKDQTSVSRVNMRRLLEAAAKAEPTVVPPSLWLALGGVPRLLSQLEENFQFRAPQPLVIGNLPVWSVEGEWKPAVLARLLPDQKDDILAGREAHLETLPEHLPHGVTIILGRDQIIPLFPYSFSFYRDVAVPGEAGHIAPRSPGHLGTVRSARSPRSAAQRIRVPPHGSGGPRTDRRVRRAVAGGRQGARHPPPRRRDVESPSVVLSAVGTSRTRRHCRPTVRVETARCEHAPNPNPNTVLRRGSGERSATA